ncbi:MAG TPA: glycosyltransferase [Candidatus Marinimicrobia bacterium]|jgi:trehalose synthase|nr:glycosyltransferase [Candidatus Neomarinimicrobiota bacterium]HQM37128.1 glycosyltransferase [Candidatus Neomarinimicrobiota bacterium]
MAKLIDYRGIVGDKVITGIFQKARGLYGKKIIHLNSTYMGGGVAEILNSLVPLMNDVGLDTGWRIIRGNPDLFTITKKFHNALQGDPINLSDMKKEIYIKASEDFSVFTHLDHDCVIIHDPQPLPLIRYYVKQQPWIWRCHVDISHPNPVLWDFLKAFILKYDLAIVSHETYKKDDIYIEQKVIPPVIDPLSPKNKELSEKDTKRFLKKFGIPIDKPLLTQISRFDKWKDPEGVVRIFKKVKKQIDCRLVLCGSMATDDPEGMKIYQKVVDYSNHLIQSGDIIPITSENNILVNSLQRYSDVIIQKSIREGFGLVVAEALWKKAAVVASNVGGIPLQVIDGETGFLCEPNDEEAFAERIIQLMKDKKLKEKLGQNGKEHIKSNFLITRLLCDYLDVIRSLLS